MYTIQAVVICYNCNKKYFPSLEGQSTSGSTICPFCDNIDYNINYEMEYLEVIST